MLFILETTLVSYMITILMALSLESSKRKSALKLRYPLSIAFVEQVSGSVAMEYSTYSESQNRKKVLFPEHRSLLLRSFFAIIKVSFNLEKAQMTTVIYILPQTKL